MYVRYSYSSSSRSSTFLLVGRNVASIGLDCARPHTCKIEILKHVFVHVDLGGISAM